MRPISGHREYIFPSSKDPKQSMNSQTANAALRRMGYKGILVSHGLRAIFSTAANEAGFSPDVIEARHERSTPHLQPFKPIWNNVGY